MVLKVDHLNREYPGFFLKDISLSLEKGEIMGLVGKNGAGKSTFIKSILNFTQPTSGKVLIFGKDFYKLKKISSIGRITKKFYPSWDESLYENYLKKFNLDENKRIKDLSNGMKVKFLITLALSHKPDLLILDEPTSGLDPYSRQEVINIFKELASKENKTILFSTHIISDLEKCADDISYIKEGELFYTGSLSEFERRYKNHVDNKLESLEDIILRIEGSVKNENI